MSKEQAEKEVFDTKPANLRKTGGVTVQSIPAEWLSLSGFRAFFHSELVIRLVRVNGQTCIEISRAPPKEET